jgi:hypothetical protein
MLLTQTSCPACQALLKFPAPITAGTRVSCPRCNGRFTLTPENPVAVPAAVSAGPPPLPVAALDRALALPGLAPAPRAGLPETWKPPAARSPWLGPILVGSVFFVAVGVGLAVYCFSSSTSADPAPAAGPGRGSAGASALSVDDRLLRGSKRLGPRLVTALPPMPLGEPVTKGLAYLAACQQPDGGWGQGEGPTQVGRLRNPAADRTNVADTCMAALALLRADNSPTAGPYAAHLNRAIDYVCKQVESSGDFALTVTAVQGTRVQMKIGRDVDTFLAALLLGEVKGRMPDARGNKRVSDALAKVIGKMERHQAADGTWALGGWAPLLGQALAVKGLNRARQAGAAVSEAALEKARQYARRNFDGRAGRFGVDGSAGVALYSAAGHLGALQDSVNTYRSQERDMRRAAAAGGTAERDEARSKLKRFEETVETQQQATRVVVKDLNNPRFVRGFGSNGGEEFLSYMNISEALAVQGGPEWEVWDRAMTDNLGRVQNGDGSWSGHHCITGRTFCTAAALLVLTADRTPVPLACKLSQR